ncbi:MAG TPA: ATP-dependent DNA helicase RecG [Anaerolineaceae bacterium]|nr:ATP-dependent DNA helicase RecG [Anaerolineaceae bacterium]
MPSSIDKLIKFFKLEAERGYDNRAVVGGLEKVIPIWEKESQADHLEETLIKSVSARLSEYRDLDPKTRSETIKQLTDILYHTNIPEKIDNPNTTQSEKQLAGNTIKQVSSSQSIPARTQPGATDPGSRNRIPNGSTPRFQDLPAASGLNAPLTVLPGVGPRYAQILHTIGLDTLGDLLYYFPRRYDDYSSMKPINRLAYGEEVTVIGTVQSSQTRPIRGGQSQLTEAVVSDGTGYLRLTWFNQPWIANKLSQGTQVTLSGKVDMYLGRLVMTNPDMEPVEQAHLHTNRITPIYPLTSRITQHWLRRIMFQTVGFWAQRIPDYIPESIRKQVGLIDLPTALYQIHFPDSQEKLKIARNRLAFDEIFLLQLGVLKQKQSWQSAVANKYEVTDDWFKQQIGRLHFTLTGAQHRALMDVRADLGSGRPMNRLLQGDVGSGKTVIAVMAINIITSHHAQAAFMAPTSILADQHYKSMLKLLVEPIDEFEAPLKPDEIGLLLGDTPDTEKNRIRAGLSDGSIKLVIGTHALIEDPVIFKCLQLVIVDEQHRFGVAQRATLRSKGENPHLMVMTATPIPRSLALTVYGDLDLTVMDEMPEGRLPIETHILHPLERERAYNLIRSQVQEGHQAFIIYPLVENGDDDQVSEFKAAVDEHTRLQKDIFPKLKLGLLHGRLRPEEKDDVMARFRDGDYQVLVSTSVVEVGVDIPNATIMLVEGANRFGLSQLHQFRGRVGRSQIKSFCLLIPETEDALENERLAVMAETTDGFVLAERDLEQRGPGDFLGTRQAGYSELKMASLTDVRLIEKARNQALAIFEQDPELAETGHKALAKMVTRFWGGGKGDIS